MNETDVAQLLPSNGVSEKKPKQQNFIAMEDAVGSSLYLCETGIGSVYVLGKVCLHGLNNLHLRMSVIS